MEPAGELTPEKVQREVGEQLLGGLMAACQESPTYLDKYYALQPGRPTGAKRLLVLLPLALRDHLPRAWSEGVGTLATLVWRRAPETALGQLELEEHEFTWGGHLREKLSAAPYPR
jgi:hypothetical protein